MILEIPSIFSDKLIKVTEFTLDDFRTISFMLENESNSSLYNFLISKIHTPCNSLDKFNVLFQARVKFVNENIVLNNGTSNITINLNVLNESFIKNTKDIKNTITSNGFEIGVNYPKHFFYNEYDEFDRLLIDCIEYISYKERTVSFEEISYNDAYKIINKLPTNILVEIKNYIYENINNKILLFSSKLNLPDIVINMFDHTAYDFIKLLYNYYSYEEITELLFMISRRISDIQFLKSRNPRELDLLVKLYSEDIEKTNQETKLSI